MDDFLKKFLIAYVNFRKIGKYASNENTRRLFSSFLGIRETSSSSEMLTFLRKENNWHRIDQLNGPYGKLIFKMWLIKHDANRKR